MDRIFHHGDTMYEAATKVYAKSDGYAYYESDCKTKVPADVLEDLFVNLADYQFGCTKGGEITKFEDFDMDFNRYKYMLETRLSGSLTKVYSAIALEEPADESQLVAG